MKKALCIVLALAGCGVQPVDESQEATGTPPNLCKQAAQDAAAKCPGVWDVGDQAAVCGGCAVGIPSIAAGGFTAAATFFACGDCIKALVQNDACAIALSHWAQCETPCVGKSNGTAVCGGPAIDYGLEFFQCQDGYPSISGACKNGQFCDPHASFQFGVINPRQCGDCDNDHGQAPASSYHNGEGYCMGTYGNAPGWHECVSKTGGPGGSWRYLPQLNNQNNCHPAAPDPCHYVSSANNGWFCGNSSQAGFRPQWAHGGSMYQCINGRTASSYGCSTGQCVIAPAGQADYCVVPSCGINGAGCSSDSDCCSGTCAYNGHAYVCHQGACGAYGAGCSSDADCCSGLCQSNGHALACH